jgi:hypothetical protein
MDTDQITETLMTNVYVPAFCKKAEALGLNITNEQDLAECIKIATAIRAEQEQAEAQADPILKQAAAALFGVEQPQVKSAGIDTDAILGDESVRQALASLTATAE